VAHALVEIANTLGETFDLTDYLHLVADRCVRLLGVSAVGIRLRDEHGEHQTAAATQERARLLDEFAVQVGQGPGIDCFRTGRPVSVPDFSAARQWPRFAAAATMTGFASVHLLPLRLRDQVIGTLSLFGDDPGTLDEDTRRIGQALADVATIGLLQHRAIHDRDVLAGQLQTALDSWVAIEQAKGILAERLQVSVADAFTLLRNGARSHNRRLSDLARAVVNGTERILPVPGTPARGYADARR
jgi:GAF domain-containing protein